MEAEEPHLIIGVSSLCLADEEKGLAVAYDIRTGAVTATAPCSRLQW